MGEKRKNSGGRRYRSLAASQLEVLDGQAWPGVLLDVEGGGASGVTVVEGADGVEGEGLSGAKHQQGNEASLKICFV